MVVLKVVLLLFFAATIQGCEKVVCNMYDESCTTYAQKWNWKKEIQGEEGKWGKSDPIERQDNLVNETPELYSNFGNMKLEGLLNAEVERIVLDDSTMNWTITVDLDASSTFEMKGSIGDCPVDGAGTVTAKYENYGISFKSIYNDIEGEDGKSYMYIVGYSIEYICEDNCKVSYNAQFDGDQEQTDRVNPYLDENFKMVQNLIGNKWLDAMLEIYMKNVVDYCKIDPKEDIFYYCN